MLSLFLLLQLYAGVLCIFLIQYLNDLLVDSPHIMGGATTTVGP